MKREHDKLHIKVGIKILLERNKRKLSQDKLAELAGLSKTALGSIERGESVPSINTVDRIAKALGMSVVELIDVSKVDL